MIPGNSKTRPLLKIAPVFFLGIILGNYISGFPPFWFSASIILFFSIIILIEITKSPVLNSLLIYLLILSSGWHFGASVKNQYKNDVLYNLASHSPEIEFTVVIIDENAGDKDNWRLLAELESFKFKDTVYNLHRKIWFEPEQRNIRLKYGDVLTGIGTFKEIPRIKNPGEFDPALYAFRNNIFAILESSPENFHKTGDKKSFLLGKIVLPLRVKICRAVDFHIGGEEGEILKALTLGLRAGFSPEFEKNLSHSGLWHLVSLSGMHLGIMAGLVFLVITALRIPGRFRWGIVIIFILFFCILAVARAPMVRAGLILCIIFGSRYLRRYTDPWNLLALSALIIVIIKPGELFGAGFQLSYTAAIFIMAGMNRMEIVIRRIRKRYLRNTVALAAVSFAATIGTAPLLAYHFGGIPFASFFASMIGVPLTGIILLLSPIFIGASFLSSIPASLLGNSLWICLKALILLVKLSADSDLYLRTPDFTNLHLILIIIPLLLFIIGKRHWLWTGLLTANIFIWMSAIKPPSYRLTFLDVGQGNAAVVETPAGKCFLIDAGRGGTNFNSGDNTIIPFLQRRGIDEIESLFLSHNDNDHSGGADAVISRMKVKQIIVGEGSVFPITAPLTYKSAGDWMKKSGLLLTFFNPTNSMDDDNDESLVFEVNYKNRSILFPGDISRRKEYELLLFGELLKSDILQVPHHGSRYSSSLEFLNAVDPEYAVISCGKDNFYGHPAIETLIRLSETGSQIERTDQSGAVIFELSENKIRKINWRKKF